MASHYLWLKPKLCSLAFTPSHMYSVLLQAAPPPPDSCPRPGLSLRFFLWNPSPAFLPVPGSSPALPHLPTAPPPQGSVAHSQGSSVPATPTQAQAPSPGISTSVHLLGPCWPLTALDPSPAVSCLSRTPTGASHRLFIIVLASWWGGALGLLFECIL